MVIFLGVKRLPEHTQADDPTLLRRIAKKPERQQVGSAVWPGRAQGDGLEGGKVLGTK